MLRFTTYYGHDTYIDPARILMVEDGGCGSRGLSVKVHFDNGKTVSLSGRVEDVQRQIAEAKTAEAEGLRATLRHYETATGVLHDGPCPICFEIGDECSHSLRVKLKAVG